MSVYCISYKTVVAVRLSVTRDILRQVFRVFSAVLCCQVLSVLSVKSHLSAICARHCLTQPSFMTTVFLLTLCHKMGRFVAVSVLN